MIKGILANVAGQVGALITILGLIPPVSFVGVSFGMAVTFLTHLGVTLNLLLFLGLWMCLASSTERRTIAATFVPAIVAAWFLYYREAASVALEAVGRVSQNLVRPDTIVPSVALIRFGKIMQNLVLKLGGLPFAAFSDWQTLPPSAKRLCRVGALCYVLAAVVAIASPVTLRFELFSAPLFCVLAAGVLDDSKSKRATCLMALLSAVLMALLLTRRFPLINVILESPRWPLAQSVGTLFS